jgi:tRNA(His) 5'-end guanylyltransferase
MGSLGDRMKAYEQVTRSVLPPRTYAVVRVDGRAFHTFTRGMERPFSEPLASAMDGVGVALCEEISGTSLAYTQSDECSVVFSDLSGFDTQMWFGGVVQKIASVAASIATAAWATDADHPLHGTRPLFDARVFAISSEQEVTNYLIWRQVDCVRNSISMAAQAQFPHKQLHGVNTNAMQEMLFKEKGINWNDYPDDFKRGRVVVSSTVREEITYTDRRTKETNSTIVNRSHWSAEAAPHFTPQWRVSLATHPPQLEDSLDA